MKKKRFLLIGYPLVISFAINSGSLSAETATNSSEITSQSIQYPNGIPEHQDSSKQSEPFLIHPAVDVQINPSIQVGPGVVIGPNVYQRGKPMPNPLIQNTLPKNHPLLTNP